MSAAGGGGCGAWLCTMLVVKVFTCLDSSTPFSRFVILAYHAVLRNWKGLGGAAAYFIAQESGQASRKLSLVGRVA